MQDYPQDSWNGLYRKKLKGVKLIHKGKYPYEFIYICFNNYITSSFPLFVQIRVKGPKMNACRNKQIYTASKRSIIVGTRGIPSIIGLVFKKIMGALLMSLLETGSLLLLLNSVLTLGNIGILPQQRKISTNLSQSPE